MNPTIKLTPGDLFTTGDFTGNGGSLAVKYTKTDDPFETIRKYSNQLLMYLEDYDMSSLEDEQTLEPYICHVFLTHPQDQPTRPVEVLIYHENLSFIGLTPISFKEKPNSYEHV